MLKLIKGKIHYFVREGKTLVKICPRPSVPKGDKNCIMLLFILQGMV